eukprot:TRINITY_DN5850_c0_g1_i3.p1 TRINITY_DN5850_c0_g1~~TRINITY_DN5850_c0_g1_i3.p1  ORF type:complete len:943 (-),score=182.16 TRINITY_DN5850_c0_g1_i3:450-3278(-)
MEKEPADADARKHQLLDSTASTESTKCETPEPSEVAEESLVMLTAPRARPPRLLRCLAVVATSLVAFCVLVGAPAVPKLFSLKMTGSYRVPDGSPSLVAEERLMDSFPELNAMSKSSVLVVVQALPGTKTVLTPDVDRFSSNITHRALSDPRTKDLGPVGAGYFLPNWMLGLHKKDPILKSGFVSPDEKTTVIAFMGRKQPAHADRKALLKLREGVILFLQEHAANPPAGCKVLLTGDPVLQWDMDHDHSIEAMLKGELVVLPLAMLVLVWLVRDVRLLLIPPITLVMAFLISAGVILPLTKILPDYSGDIPPAMISVCIALTLDFNLFFLTRFRNNRKLNMPLQENVENMVSYTGHTVCISGALIVVAFCGAVLIPQHNLSTAGLCLGVTSAACILVCITIPPTLLFYCSAVFASKSCEVGCGGSARDTEIDVEMAAYSQAGPIETSREDDEFDSPVKIHEPREVQLEIIGEHPDDYLFELTRKDLQQMTDDSSSAGGFWLRLMRLIDKRPRTAILVVLLLFSPLVLATTQLHQTGDTYGFMPTTLPSIQALRAVSDAEFPVGRFQPYLLIVSRKDLDDDRGLEDSLTLPGKKKSAMMTPYAFHAMSELVTSVQQVGNVAGVLGATHLVDTPIDWHYAEALLSNNMARIKKLTTPPRTPFQTHRLYDIIMASHVKERYAAIELHTQSPPRGAGSTDWVLDVRQKIAAWEAAYPDMTASVSGGSAKVADTRAVVVPSIPRYVAFTTAVVMLLVAFMFRSLMLPLRLAFALVFTVLATFGATVIVYQTSLFHWLAPELRYFDGLVYAAVPQTICIAIALGIDYDIFLISRIFEYRKLGFTDREAIVYGVAKTGSIISGAGLIMALAFSGLMMSPKLMLQQFGFILIVSVLLDAFVVRTVLVPALMLSAGDWNWWPLRMPPQRDARLLVDDQVPTSRNVMTTRI